MATLTVWIATQDYDNKCFNVIGKTRKSVLEQLAQRDDAHLYNAPVKVDIFYKDAFDLFEYVTSENGGRHIHL